MTLLDRFRTQPNERHPDPAVRLAHVQALPLEQSDAIAAVARDDPEPKVRCAAVAKLLEPGLLGEIARSDADESVRVMARDMLRDVALEAFERVSEADALAAVDAMPDPKVVAQVARSAPRETVALHALSRVPDGRMLGSIARHGVTGAVRLGALAALGARQDPVEILAVALNSEFKDSAVAAVDLIGDRPTLEQVAVRSRNKNAVKRARGIIRELDERAAREAAAHAAAAAEARMAAESHQEPHAPMSTDTLIDPTSSPSAALTDPAPDPAPAIPEPEAPVVAADAAVDAAAEPSGEPGADPVPSPDAPGAVVEPPAGSPAVDAAPRDTEAQDAEVKARREGLARMHNLLGRVEQLVARPDLSLKAADRALRDVRAAIGAIPPLPSRADYDDVSARLKAVQDALTPRVSELREADEWQKWANVTIQEQLCARMEALNALEDPDAIVKEVRDLQQQWRQAADVPRDKADLLWRRFKAAHDQVWSRCETYFADQARERAENLTRKTALCEQVEALADSTNWIQTAEAIKKLQAEWKTIGPVSRGREKAIWDRFRIACDRFFTRRHEDLAQRKGMWAENLAKKDALCVQAEALAESTDWDAAAADIKKLQAEWKTIGPVKKSRSEAIWQRFRGACDRFFDRYAHRHDLARAERVAAREALCVEIEALAPAEAETADAPADLLATVRAIRARWQQEIASRGVDPDRARALDARFAEAFGRVVARWPAVFSGTDLDPDANRKRMEQLVRKIEDLAASLAGPAPTPDASLSPANRLAAMLKEALAANTIGGKVDDDTRWRAAAEEVRQAQAAWSRLGPVPDAARRQLLDRFQRAARRITERAESSSRTAASRPQGRPAGGRGAERGKTEGRNPRREHASPEQERPEP